MQGGSADVIITSQTSCLMDSSVREGKTRFPLLLFLLLVITAPLPLTLPPYLVPHHRCLALPFLVSPPPFITQLCFFFFPMLLPSFHTHAATHEPPQRQLRAVSPLHIHRRRPSFSFTGKQGRVYSLPRLPSVHH